MAEATEKNRTAGGGKNDATTMRLTGGMFEVGIVDRDSEDHMWTRSHSAALFVGKTNFGHGFQVSYTGADKTLVHKTFLSHEVLAWDVFRVRSQRNGHEGLEFFAVVPLPLGHEGDRCHVGEECREWMLRFTIMGHHESFKLLKIACRDSGFPKRGLVLEKA